MVTVTPPSSTDTLRRTPRSAMDSTGISGSTTSASSSSSVRVITIRAPGRCVVSIASRRGRGRDAPCARRCVHPLPDTGRRGAEALLRRARRQRSYPRPGRRDEGSCADAVGGDPAIELIGLEKLAGEPATWRRCRSACGDATPRCRRRVAPPIRKCASGGSAPP